MRSQPFRGPLLLAVLSLSLLQGCSGPKESARPTDDSDEEVEIGYGTQKRKNVTGAVSSVDPKEAGNPAATRVEDLLIGRVPGVYVSTTPGGALSVQIRGVTSFHGSNEPLYVVDGIPISPGPGGTLIGINVNDVASIQVLKDAASTAIYGSRGANGVVLITTKRGQH